MKRMLKIGLMERISGNMPDGVYFRAKNLDDLLKTLETHELEKNEIIKIIFPNQIKLEYLDDKKYNLPYFFNDDADTKFGKFMSQSYISEGCTLVSAQDTSINNTIFMYGHKNLTQSFKDSNSGQIILLKPFITFQSLNGIGIATFNEFD